MRHEEVVVGGSASRHRGRRRLRLVAIGIGLSTVLAASTASAQLPAGKTGDVEVVDFAELDLEELLNMRVVAATKAQQRISDAPVIVDAVTIEQMIDLGVDNLHELLGMLPGIEIMETYRGYANIQFRGILQSHYNNKVSLLLDGRPLYDQVVSTYYLEQVSLLSIARVEVIRGPGGVFHGSNAYAGVINIVTRQGAEVNGAYATLRMGDFGTRHAKAVVGDRGDDIDVILAVDSHESDGYDRIVAWDEDDVVPGQGGNSDGSRRLGAYADDADAYENDYASAYAALTWRGLSLKGSVFRNEHDKFGLIPTLASTGERRIDGSGVSLDYDATYGNGAGRVRFTAWYDQVRNDERINAVPPKLIDNVQANDQEYAGRKSGSQVEASGPVARNLSYAGGLGYEAAHADPYLSYFTGPLTPRIENRPASPMAEGHDTWDSWVYGHLSWRLAERFSLYGGARVSENEQAGTAVLPSLGAVVTARDNLSFKVLVGKGFRNPSFYEKYSRSVNVLAGIEELEPEEIRTVDLGVDFRLARYAMRLNLYFTDTENTIGTVDMSAEDLDLLNLEPGFGSGFLQWTGGLRYANLEGDSYRGLELAVQGAPHPNWRVWGNLSLREGTDAGGRELRYFAPLLANLGFRVDPLPWASLATRLQFVGERKGSYAPVWAWNEWEPGDYALAGYLLADLKATVYPQKDLELAVTVKNAFDADYDYPEYIRRAIPSIPGGPSRALFLSIGYRVR